MPHIYSIISNAAFSPPTVKLMGQVFDDAWATLQSEYAENRPAEIDLARLALAKAIVTFAALGNDDPQILKSKALSLLRAPTAREEEPILRT